LTLKRCFDIQAEIVIAGLPSLQAPLLEDVQLITSSFTPWPIFTSCFSGDIHVDYLKLQLEHNITKGSVEHTNTCIRILREHAKQHLKATFKETCEEKFLAVSGVLLLSSVNKVKSCLR